MWHVHMSVHTTLDELHVIFCQSPRFVCKHILHLEIEQSVTYLHTSRYEFGINTLCKGSIYVQKFQNVVYDLSQLLIQV